MSSIPITIRQRFMPGAGARIAFQSQDSWHVLRDMPSPSDLPKDRVGREIVLLLHEHCEIAEQFDIPSILALSVDGKMEVLSQIRGMLGIRPIRKRTLGYVGP